MALAALPMAAGCRWTSDDVDRARKYADEAMGGAEGLKFFTDDEFEVARLISDLILPPDDRSGSASDLGVPEFIDFIVSDLDHLQAPVREGMAWLESHARERFQSGFAGLLDDQRTAILDEIAYPDDAASEVEAGVEFFNLFRNLTASGFWTTREGMADLEYMGNVAVARWAGPPSAEMGRLGLSFDDWDVVS